MSYYLLYYVDFVSSDGTRIIYELFLMNSYCINKHVRSILKYCNIQKHHKKDLYYEVLKATKRKYLAQERRRGRQFYNREDTLWGSGLEGDLEFLCVPVVITS